MPQCKAHHVQLVCLACLGATGGKVRTEVKAQAARENGKRGGRPKGSKNKPKS